MDPAIATIIGAIIGALITGITAYYFSICLGRRQEFNKAAGVFRSAFTDELRKLHDYSVLPDDIKDETVLEMLKSARVKHENACIRFKPYLSEPHLESFDKAWKEYCYPQGGDPKQVPGPFYEYFVNLSNNDAINLAISKIDALLEFAQPIAKIRR